jgi:hypothetical protein
LLAIEDTVNEVEADRARQETSSVSTNGPPGTRVARINYREQGE